MSLLSHLHIPFIPTSIPLITFPVSRKKLNVPFLSQLETKPGVFTLQQQNFQNLKLVAGNVVGGFPRAILIIAFHNKPKYRSSILLCKNFDAHPHTATLYIFNCNYTIHVDPSKILPGVKSGPVGQSTNIMLMNKVSGSDWSGATVVTRTGYPISTDIKSSPVRVFDDIHRMNRIQMP